jgi:transcriptional regulator with XRE-family HTH domain
MARRPDTTGGRIRAQRVKVGLGLRETARLAGIDPSVMSRIENDRRPARASELAVFARLFRCPVGSLIPRSRRVAA